MKNNNGYTIAELMIVIVVVGVLAFVGINSASYAFSDREAAKAELKNSRIELIEKQAVLYGEANKSLFKENDTTYIRVIDLVNNNFLVSNDESVVGNNQKIKLVLKDDKVEAFLEK